MEPQQFLQPRHPLAEQGRKPVEDWACRVVLNVPLRVTGFLLDPVQEFLVLYLQPRHVVPEVVDQFFKAEFSTATLSPSSSTAAAIFQEGLT